MKNVFRIVMWVLLISADASAQSPAATIPAFTFFRLDKTAFTNKDLALGKPLFFVFFDAECEHCQHAVSYINLHHRDFKKAAIYFITLDPKVKLDAFMKKYGANLAGRNNLLLLQDLNNEFINKFGPKKYPSLFLFSPKGKLILYDDEEKSLPAFSKAASAD